MTKTFLTEDINIQDKKLEKVLKDIIKHAEEIKKLNKTLVKMGEAGGAKTIANDIQGVIWTAEFIADTQ